MRKVLLILATTLLTISCNHKQKEQTESPQTKTLTATEIRNQEIQDSLKQVKTDSLALIAWGDAKFGMTMEEALKTNAFKDYSSNVSDTELGQKLSLSIEKLEIGNYNIDVLQFNVFFRNNELCDILIKSYPQPADHIDDLVNDALVIANQFYKKYGEATKSFDGQLSAFHLSKREPFYLRRWKISSKEINITFWEKSGYEYDYSISIDNWRYPLKKDLKRTKKEVKKQKERKKLEEYQF